MAETGMTLQVSPELVRPVIEAKIQAAIVAELAAGEQTGLFGAIITRVLTQKVDSDGKPDSDHYHNCKTYLEWLCQCAVRNCAQKAIKEWVENNQAKFQKHFRDELSKRSGEFSKVFADGLLRSIKSDWKINVGVTLETLKD